MTASRIGYALLLLTALALDVFCGSVVTLALTLLPVLTPLVCLPLHLWAAKRLRLQLEAPVNLEQGEAGALCVRVETGTWLPLCRKGTSSFLQSSGMSRFPSTFSRAMFVPGWGS